MRPQSYIGITGFSSRGEVERVVAARPQESEHLLMIGMLVSHKSLHGQPVEKPKRYPKREVVPSIFMPGKNLLNLIHFNTKNPEVLADDMKEAHELAGEHCHGFQLNMAWPEADAIEQYRVKYPNAKIVLQCGASALEAVRESGAVGEKFVKRVASYGPLVDYVLIDQSGGQGLMFDHFYVEQCFELLSQGTPNLGLVVAGGLQSENLHSLYFLWKKFKDFSFDAESKLRDGNDVLSISRAVPYLQIADAVFTRRRKRLQAA